MKITEELGRFMKDRAADYTIEDVRLGLGYTAVLLNDGSAGAAFTFRDAFNGGCSAFKGSRTLAGRPAPEILEYLLSSNPLEAAVGLAVVNALANKPRPDLTRGDVLEVVEITDRDRVGMVGFFAPVMPALKQKAGEILVFERRAPKGSLEKFYPAEEAERLLPECHVALITATALLNGAMDGLLNAAAGCREVVILGSSTPLCPEVFASTPATRLSGIIVTDSQGLLRVVSEGGGTRQFKGLVEKVNCSVRE